MATAADRPHGASVAGAHGATSAGAPAPAHVHDHVHDHAAGHAHGHGAHVDTSGDKAAAFVGLIGGAVLLGAMMYGMVAWTNSRYAGHEGGERAAATSTH